MKIKPFLIAFCCLFLTASYPTKPNAEKIAGVPSYSNLSGWWQFSPQVIVCKRSGLREGNVKSAVNYWKKLGYDFEPIIFAEHHNTSCINGPEFGEIVLDMPSQEFNFINLGQTKTHLIAETFAIIKAKIEIQKIGIMKERVLEHEIGHALGWDHTRRSYHIMHPTWQRGGWDSMGLTYRRYTELAEKLLEN